MSPAERDEMTQLLRRIETFAAGLRRDAEQRSTRLSANGRSALIRHLRGAECAAAVERQQIERGVTTGK